MIFRYFTIANYITSTLIVAIFSREVDMSFWHLKVVLAGLFYGLLGHWYFRDIATIYLLNKHYKTLKGMLNKELDSTFEIAERYNVLTEALNLHLQSFVRTREDKRSCILLISVFLPVLIPHLIFSYVLTKKLGNFLKLVREKIDSENYRIRKHNEDILRNKNKTSGGKEQGQSNQSNDSTKIKAVEPWTSEPLDLDSFALKVGAPHNLPIVKRKWSLYVMQLNGDEGTEVIKKKHRDLMRKFHPDVNKSNNALKVSQLVNQAMDVLKAS